MSIYVQKTAQFKVIEVYPDTASGAADALGGTGNYMVNAHDKIIRFGMPDQDDVDVPFGHMVVYEFCPGETPKFQPEVLSRAEFNHRFSQLPGSK